MSKIILLTIQFFIVRVAVCQNDLDFERFKFPLKSLTSYCQDSSDTSNSTISFKYDSSKRLIKIISFHGFDSIVTAFSYNERGLLASKQTYTIPERKQPEPAKIFKYDKNNKLIYEGYDDGKGIKNNYCYNGNGQLITTLGECNERHWKYVYEYNALGKLVKKYEDGAFDETTYEYSQNNLIKETRRQRNGDIETTYDYDGDGLLLYKKENGKVIERNIYNQDQLVERWTYYFGGDPGFSPCNSQYITKFEYY